MHKYTPDQSGFSTQSSDLYVLWGGERRPNEGVLMQLGTAALHHPTLMEEDTRQVCKALP